LIAYDIVLMQEEIGCVQDVINALIKRKSCKSQYIRAEKTLTVGKVPNLITVNEGSSCRDSKKPARRVRVGRRCGRCSKIRYDSYTYIVGIENVHNSNASK
jgi:hypothetical protein